VRYTGAADPELTFFCHCLACQREAGGPFSVELFIAKDAVSIARALNAYEATANSGNRVARKGCPTCNSPIVLEMNGYPEHASLEAGNLDDAASLVPRPYIFAAASSLGSANSDDSPQFEGVYEQ
jgi:hypothetical protein